jgi:hypothetical protein
MFFDSQYLPGFGIRSNFALACQARGPQYGRISHATKVLWGGRAKFAMSRPGLWLSIRWALRSTKLLRGTSLNVQHDYGNR